MNHKYIDNKTFDIIDNVFEVDEDIAEAISILNKKGYYTKFCCSGHVKEPRLYEMYNRKNNILYKDSYLGHVVNKNDDNYDILMPYTFTAAYITFSDKYNFDYLPVGFTKVDGFTIERIIEYYNNGKRKSSNYIDKEIKEVNRLLLSWANSLPLNK